MKTYTETRKGCLRCVDEYNYKMTDTKYPTWAKSDQRRRDELMTNARKSLLYSRPTMDKDPMWDRRLLEAAEKLAERGKLRICLWCGERFYTSKNTQAFCYQHTQVQRRDFTKKINWERNLIADEEEALRKRKRMSQDANAEQPTIAPDGECAPQDIYLSSLSNPDDIAFYREVKRNYWSEFTPENEADKMQVANMIYLSVRNRQLHRGMMADGELNKGEKDKAQDEIRKNSDTIIKIQNTLGVSKSERRKQKDSATAEDLLQGIIDDAFEVFQTTEFGPNPVMCGDCPKLIEYAKRITEDAVARVKGVDVE